MKINVAKYIEVSSKKLYILIFPSSLLTWDLVYFNFMTIYFNMYVHDFRGMKSTYEPTYILQETSAFALSSGVSVWNALVFEIVMTFGLVYTVYATAVDPKKGNLGNIAPIAIGFIVGANILAGGPFDGASMNPAVSFGPAVVSWNFTNHWVYWIGPFIGATIAALVYDNIYIDGETHEQLPVTDY